MHGLAPNDIHVQYKYNPRLGRRAVPIVPPLHYLINPSSQQRPISALTVTAARLWNIPPKDVTSQTTLEIEALKELGVLGSLLDMFLDNPPTKGYTATNNNPRLESE